MSIDIFRNGLTGSNIGTRLTNVKNEDITSNKLIIFKNNNEIESTSISATGQQILNSVSLPELKTLLLEQTQEAIVYSNTDGQREINFHIKTADIDPIDSSNLRLSIKEDKLQIYDDIIPMIGNRDLGSDTNQFGSLYGSNIKIGRIYSKEPNAEIYLDMTLDTKLLTYKNFEPQTADLNIGSTSNPFNNIYLSDSIIADSNTAINFNALKYIFYTQGALNKKLEITNASCDFNNCNMRLLGNDKEIVLCSNNGTEHLKLKYITAGGGKTSIDSLTVPLHITTGSNQNIIITPNGVGNIYLNRHIYMPAGACVIRNQEVNKHFQLNLSPNNEAPNSTTASYGSGISFWASFFSETDPAPRLFANINCRTTGANWEGGQLDFRVRENGASGSTAGITGDQAELNSLQMTIYPQSVDIFKTLNVSNNIIPASTNTVDLGSSTKILNNTYSKTSRVIGSGGYIDMRSVNYTTQGEGTDTTPIYFNTGYYVAGTDQSTTRKSMILGRASANTFPNNRETSGNGRNNIVFCVNNEGNPNSVTANDEIMRVGQTAVYLKKSLIPFDGVVGVNLGYDATDPSYEGNVGDSWFDAGYITNMYYGGIHQNSDSRLKTNVKNLEIGLDIINKIQPKSYNWKKNNKFDFGVIAQDILEIPQIKNLISTRDCGLYSMNYVALIPILIKSIQQLDTKINQISHTAGHQVDSVKRNISMSVVELDDFKQMEDLKEQATNSQIRIDTLKMRVDKMEGVMSDKTNAPTEKQIDEARLEILEARVEGLETKEHKCEHKCSGKDGDTDEESDGNMNVLDLIQQRLHELEKRNTKLEAKVKKQTTIINKLLKND